MQTLIYSVLMLLIVACAAAADLEQMALQQDLPWWDKYFFELAVSFGTSAVGYVAAQHYKTRSVQQSAMSIAGVNGIVTGVLAIWIFHNHYDWNQSAQWGVMVGGGSPMLVWLLFQIVDRAFPGKGDVLKKGLFIPEDDQQEKTLLQKAKDIAVVAVVGKRKDQRKRAGTDVWTPEKRQEMLNQMDSEIDPTRVLTPDEVADITGERPPRG